MKNNWEKNQSYFLPFRATHIELILFFSLSKLSNRLYHRLLCFVEEKKYDNWFRSRTSSFQFSSMNNLRHILLNLSNLNKFQHKYQ